MGSLVYQLPRGITLAYDLCLGCTIAHWKGQGGSILGVLNFWGHFEGRNNVFSRSGTSMIVEVSNFSYEMMFLINTFSTSYHVPQNKDRMPKLHPREVDTPNYPKQCPQNCWISCSGVRVLEFLYDKKAFGASF